MKHTLEYVIESKPEFSKKYGKFWMAGTLKANSFEELAKQARDLIECFKENANIIIKDLSLERSYDSH